MLWLLSSKKAMVAQVKEAVAAPGKRSHATPAKGGITSLFIA
jgi:hypothetical protein